MSNWNISLSYDFKWNKLNSDIHGFVYPRRLSNLVSLATAIDLGRVKIQSSVLATFADDHTRTGTAPEGASSVTPAVFVSWTPAEDCPLSLRAFAKKSFRMPTFNDLYYVDVGNAKLKPETAIQYNIGAAYSKTWSNSMLTMLRLQADAYYNTVSDKIMAFPKGTQFRWTMMNLGKVHISGIDATAEASLSPTPRLTIGARLQYTWQRAIDVTSSNTSYYKDQLPYTPEHSGSAMITVAYGNTELNYSLLYSGERYSQQENIERNRMDAWHTSDIALTHKIRIKDSQLSISAEVNNLFNKDYDVVKNFPMPLRSYSVGMKFIF
jgi:outer membrane receptor protein involved in Fe transport